MDPLRKRFFVNGEPVTGSTLHAPYLKPANTLLNAIKQRMQLGGLQQLAQRYITEDGAVLTAMSRFGQDEIRIDVPYRQGGSVTHQEVPVIETPEFVRVLHVQSYTLWLVDASGVGLIEYDENMTPTGRAFPDLLPAFGVQNYGTFTSLIFAHGALWAGHLIHGNGGYGAVLRIDVSSGEVLEVAREAMGNAVLLTSSPSHVVAHTTNAEGRPAAIRFLLPDGTDDGQANTEYVLTPALLTTSDTNLYIAGQGGFSGGIWQTGGAYLTTVPLDSRAVSTDSFVSASGPDNGFSHAWDEQGQRLLLWGDDPVEGTYHDWACIGGVAQKIASYGFDSSEQSSLWVNCDDLLIRAHTSGNIEVLRGNAAPSPIPSFVTARAIWDGMGAVWVMGLNGTSTQQQISRANLSGLTTTYALPEFPWWAFQPIPAIQLRSIEVTLPATEPTPEIPDDLPARELRVVRSRAF